MSTQCCRRSNRRYVLTLSLLNFPPGLCGLGTGLSATRQGKAPSTQAGEYVREEMHKTKKGTKEVQSRKQAVAIGQSKARQDGVNVPRKKRAA